MKPILADTLSVLLPAEDDTLLLRACLLSGDEGRNAWRAWVECVGDPKAEVAHRRPVLSRLLPLLHAATRRYDADVEPGFAFYLRAATFREQLRSRAYQGILRSVLGALDEEGVPVVVLKGAALAATAYENWALRHCHDLDLLVDEANLAAASRPLQAAGLVETSGSESGMRDVRLLHRSGLPVELHADLFGHPFYHGEPSWIADRVETPEILGRTTSILAPPAMLVHICGHASYAASRASRRWVADAWMLVAMQSALDWDAFLSDARETKLSLPLHVQLSYLRNRLGAAIPSCVLQVLERSARRPGALAREAALWSVRAARPDLERATRDWRSRAILAKWTLLPSATYLRWTGNTRSRWAILLVGLKRGARRALRSIPTPLNIAGRAAPTLRGESDTAIGAPRRAERPWMPTKRQVLLVRAALLEREPATEAWNRWKATGGFERIDDGSSALLPIVYRNLANQGVSDPEVSRAKNVYKATWLENERRFREISVVLGWLSAAGIESMLLKGAALAWLYYRDLGLRSMGDVDLLVRPERAREAMALLQEHGFRVQEESARALTDLYLFSRNAVNLASATLPKLDLHWRVVREARGGEAEEAFWDAAVPVSVHGVPTRAPCAEDLVLHICAHEARWCPSPLPRWMADVAVVLREAGGAFRPARLDGSASRLELVSPVQEALACLAAGVPEVISPALVEAVREASPAPQDSSAYARRCRRSGVFGILREEYAVYKETTRGLSAVRRWLGFPRYLRTLWGLRHSWQLASHTAAWGWRAVRRSASRARRGRHLRHS